MRVYFLFSEFLVKWRWWEC